MAKGSPAKKTASPKKASPAKKTASPKKAAKKEKAEKPKGEKKPLKGFFLFSQKNRDAVKKANPTFAVTEIAKELGKRWGALSAAEKAKY